MTQPRCEAPYCGGECYGCINGKPERRKIDRATSPAPPAGPTEVSLDETSGAIEAMAHHLQADGALDKGLLCVALDRIRVHLRLLRAGKGWQRSADCPDDIQILAGLNLPALGMSCTQAAMHHSGKRYVFVYDNPAPAKGFWWMELQPLPSPPSGTKT